MGYDNYREPAPEYEPCSHCNNMGEIYTEYNPITGEDIREITYKEYLSLSPDVRNKEQCPICHGEGFVPIDKELY